MSHKTYSCHLYNILYTHTHKHTDDDLCIVASGYDKSCQKPSVAISTIAILLQTYYLHSLMIDIDGAS